MTGKERIMTALMRRQADVVPIWEMAYNEPSIIGIARYYMDEDKLPANKPVMDMTGEEKLKLLAAMMTFVKAMDLDGTTAVSLAPRERVDNDHMRDALGVVYHMSDVGEPYPIDGPIREYSDLKRFKMRPPENLDFLMLDVLRSNMPDKAVALHMPGPFKLSWTLRGEMERLFEDYVMAPEFVHELARMVTDNCHEVLEKACAKGADFIVMEGDLAHNPAPLMSPRHYEEFILPYHKELCEHAHKLGLKIIKHSDGNLDMLVPMLISSGFDGIHPIQPQCMDIGRFKREYGDKVCTLGNIDCAFLLVFGSPEEVRQSVKETIAIAAPGGGYIISSSNSIHPGCKPENYISMVKAAREFGKYASIP